MDHKPREMVALNRHLYKTVTKHQSQRKRAGESVKMAEISIPQKRKRAHPRKLTMEKYLNFLHAVKRPALPAAHLNQIIFMHGFRKFKKNDGMQKGVLVELVNKLELVDPTRSTVNDDGLTSDAVLSMGEVINDLNDLSWQEACSITSIQTLNAAVDHHHHHQGGAAASQGYRPAGKRRRLRKMGDVGPKKAVFENWGPRKKRTLRSRRKKSVGSGPSGPSGVGVGVGVASSMANGAASSSVAIGV